MPASPAPADPGRDDDLAWPDRDPMTAAELEAGLDRVCEQDEGHLQDEDEYGDFEPLTPEELAEIREAAADELLAVEAATTGRRGPGQPGSARVFPGQSSSPAAAFGPGMVFDLLPGCAGLAVAADAAAGEDGRFAGVSEAELVGVVCAWDRVEAHAAARKLAAIAELARRSPEPGDQEFTADQVAYALAESRSRAEVLIDLARTLQIRLPGTLAALLDGTITRYKAEIIARATVLLDDAEARAAEQKVLDRAARLTPGGLRAAIAHAVIEVAPEKARERREQAARERPGAGRAANSAARHRVHGSHRGLCSRVAGGVPLAQGRRGRSSGGTRPGHADQLRLRDPFAPDRDADPRRLAERALVGEEVARLPAVPGQSSPVPGRGTGQGM
jgi:hypothetical protein